MKKLLVLVFIMTLLIGCGSSGGGSSSSSGSDVTISGIVANSNVSGQVCYDRNNNKVCDFGEPSSTIESDGSFVLTGTQADSVVSPIIAELSSSGTYSTLSATNQVFVLETLPGKRLISPVTTLVKAKVDSNPLLSVDAAQAEVKFGLGISSGVDLFDPNNVSTTSTANEQVYSVITLFVEAMNKLYIQFSSGLMSLIYAEVNAQLPSIMSNTLDDIVNNSVGGKTKEDLEQEIAEINEPKAIAAEELIGISMYMFHESRTHSGYYFNLWEFDVNGLHEYRGSGAPEWINILPTPFNYKEYELIPLTINGGTMHLTSIEGEVEIHKFYEIDADGKTLKTHESLPPQFQKTITFTTGAIIYKILAYDSHGELFNELAFYDGNYGYFFNKQAADDILSQW